MEKDSKEQSKDSNLKHYYTSKPFPKIDAIDADMPEKAFSLILSIEILTVITCWMNKKI